jgi:hypothetical protein
MIDGKIHVGPRKTEDRGWLIKEIIIINGLKIMARNGLRLLMLQERMLNDKKKKNWEGNKLDFKLGKSRSIWEGASAYFEILN